MRSMTLRFFVVSLFVGLFVSTAWAQQAQLSGVVRDSSGAVVPNATVKAIRKDTGTSSTTQTNAEGIYTLPYLKPGVYDVEASASGFKRITQADLNLQVAGNTVLDFTLEVGKVTQTVTVSGGGTPLLQTGDASVGTVITGKETTQLPLNGRYFTSLLDLVPGTIPSVRTSLFENSNPSKGGMEFNGMPVYDVNGQSGAYVVSRIDGIDNTEREFGGQLIPISVDAIQEFKLQ